MEYIAFCESFARRTADPFCGFSKMHKFLGEFEIPLEALTIYFSTEEC